MRFILLALVAMSVWEWYSPGGHPRHGILGLDTTRGDRLFISLLGSAFILLAWLGIIGTPLWGGLVLSLVFAAGGVPLGLTKPATTSRTAERRCDHPQSSQISRHLEPRVGLLHLLSPFENVEGQGLTSNVKKSSQSLYCEGLRFSAKLATGVRWEFDIASKVPSPPQP